LLAIAATTTFSRSLDNWFNRQTSNIVMNSLDVAHAYLEEHGQVIRTDIVNMGKDLDDAATEVASDPRKFRELMFAQAGLRDLPVAYVVDGKGNVKVAALEDERIPYIPPPEHLIRVAEQGHVPLLMPVSTFRVAAIAKLRNYPDSYLYVARGVSPKVVTHLRNTERGVTEYEQLRERRGGLKFAHGLMYFMISLTALLAAVWVGLWFAGLLVAPIRRLISAAQQVAKGNLSVQLPIRRGEGDLRRLSMNFNTMTQELERQRTDLVTANSQLTERRRFMEAVLSAGISPMLCRSSPACSPRAPIPMRAAARRSRSRSLSTATSAASPYASRTKRKARVTRARCLPSTTSLSWYRRSAPQPGRTWRAASRTRSRTRSRRYNSRQSASNASTAR
jgi:two-component system nitrogen regulation sensor histidine kinase NtrY